MKSAECLDKLIDVGKSAAGALANKMIGLEKVLNIANQAEVCVFWEFHFHFFFLTSKKSFFKEYIESFITHIQNHTDLCVDSDGGKRSVEAEIGVEGFV